MAGEEIAEEEGCVVEEEELLMLFVEEIMEGAVASAAVDTEAEDGGLEANGLVGI